MSLSNFTKILKYVSMHTHIPYCVQNKLKSILLVIQCAYMVRSRWRILMFMHDDKLLAPEWRN